MSKKLIGYLAGLNSSDTTWGLWVNPKNFDEFRIGQRQFESGGLLDGKVYAGNLEALSFGFQDIEAAIVHILGAETTIQKVDFKYKGQTFRDSPLNIYNLYMENELEPEMQDWLKGQIDLLQAEWAKEAAEEWVSDTLPELLEAECTQIR